MPGLSRDITETDETRESKVDVLIVGAGPAGLMCASALKAAGIDVRIIDNRPERVVAGHADGIQPRTIEVLKSYGLEDRFLREGNHMHTAAFYNPGPDGGIYRTHKGPDVNAPTARFPFKVTLNQGAIEAIFLDALRERYACAVERPCFPVSLDVSEMPDELADPEAYPVRVTISHPESQSAFASKQHFSSLTNDHPPTNDHVSPATTTTIRAKYLIGADGAHSWIRRTLGIAMDGDSSSENVWGVLDFVPLTDFPDIRNRCNVHSLQGACMVIPREDDKIRLYLQLPKEQEGYLSTDGRVDRSRMSVEKLMEVANRTLAPYTIRAKEQVEWWAIYQIGQRVASAFSAHSNRVFIMGDACHTHSPKAGQGMNAAINDAHNLAWKLAHVLRQRPDAIPSTLSSTSTSRAPTKPLRHRYRARAAELLPTYEQERRKYARDLIAFDRKWSGLFSGTPWSKFNTAGVTHDAFLGLFQAEGGFTSGVGIRYAESTLSLLLPSSSSSSARSPRHGQIVVGERVPPYQLLQAVDWRPQNLQDVLPSDTRWKLLVFAGDCATVAQRHKVQMLAAQLADINAWFTRLGGNVVALTGSNPHSEVDHKVTINGSSRLYEENTLFDVLSILSTKKEDADLNLLPHVLRPHWSKVFVDDDSINEPIYTNLGIPPDGALVLVRPDGYVAAFAPALETAVQDLEPYFSKLYETI